MDSSCKTTEKGKCIHTDILMYLFNCGKQCHYERNEVEKVMHCHFE